MAEPLLALDGLTKRFGEQEAVRGIHLEIDEGEFIALMGPSGCGKTTTLRMIAGLEEPSSGEVRLKGERINERKPWERDTPMVWQSLALFPYLSGARERRVRPQDARDSRQGATRKNAQVAGAGGHRRLREPQHRATLGRREAAGCARPRARDRTAHSPARRAVERARRAPQGAHAGGDHPASAPARNHLRLRDPQPVRGLRHGEPRRHHGRGSPSSRSARRAKSTARPPTVSSPSSSAQTTSSRGACALPRVGASPSRRPMAVLRSRRRPGRRRRRAIRSILS